MFMMRIEMKCMYPGVNVLSVIIIFKINIEIVVRIFGKINQPCKRAKRLIYPSFLKNLLDIASVWFLYFGQCFHWVNEKPKRPHLKSSVKLKRKQVSLNLFVYNYKSQTKKQIYIFFNSSSFFL